MYQYVKKTRAWNNPSVTNTIVQFRTDVSPFVSVHSNVGWQPVGNCPSDPEKAELFAEKLAKRNNLTETTQEFAEHLAGWVE